MKKYNEVEMQDLITKGAYNITHLTDEEYKEFYSQESLIRVGFCEEGNYLGSVFISENGLTYVILESCVRPFVMKGETMRELYNLFEIVENNEVCVVLRPSQDSTPLEIIASGFFDGNEEIIRMTKGATTTATVITYKDERYQWQWGDGGSTLVSDSVRKKGHIIKEMLEVDFGIYMGTDQEKIRATKNIKEIGQAPPVEIKIMYFENSSDRVVIHKDDEFLRGYRDIHSAREWLSNKYLYEIQEEFVAQTGCIVERYLATRKPHVLEKNGAQIELEL